jgi:hypothetical protein
MKNSLPLILLIAANSFIALGILHFTQPEPIAVHTTVTQRAFWAGDRYVPYIDIDIKW